jgi:NitT/TauT family transport system ATP-binding protein
MTAPARLSLQAVGKSFAASGGGEFTAIRDVSLEVAPGEFLAVLGPSGCGKSTLLQMAAGLLAPSTGRVMLDGTAVTAPPPHLVYLFQNYAKSLFPWRSARRNVEFPLEEAGVKRAERQARALALLEMVGLHEAAQRHPWQMSGGMQQRLAIARALAAEPRVLLLDEPFSAVDALTRMELQSLVLDLFDRRGLSIVLVTHDVDEAVFMADRIAVLGGKPSTVTAWFEVDVPRPRDPVLAREDVRFIRLRHQLLDLLLQRTPREAEHA